jgi:hypothetical protein
MKADLARFDIPARGFSAGLVKISSQVISIFIPEGANVSLKNSAQLKIKKIQLTQFSLTPVTTISVDEGFVGADGSAGQAEIINLPTSVSSFWSIGQVGIRTDWWGSAVFIALRHWSTLVGYLIALSIGSVSRVGAIFQLVVVVSVSRSLLYASLFLAAIFVGVILRPLIRYFPVMWKQPLILNCVFCIAYPEVGLWLVALQIADQRYRVLIAQLALLKAMRLLALLYAIMALFLGDLKQGLASVLIPGSNSIGLAQTVLPLLLLYRPKNASDCVKERLRSIFVGCGAAAIISVGAQVFWLVIPLQLAILPISAFTRKPHILPISIN